MSRVKVGAVLLDYSAQLYAVAASLVDASAAAREAAVLFAGDTDFYDGDARVEMKQFYESLSANVDKLVFLGDMGAQYLNKVFEEFEFTEEELTAVIDHYLEDQ